MKLQIENQFCKNYNKDEIKTISEYYNSIDLKYQIGYGKICVLKQDITVNVENAGILLNYWPDLPLSFVKNDTLQFILSVNERIDENGNK